MQFPHHDLQAQATPSSQLALFGGRGVGRRDEGRGKKVQTPTRKAGEPDDPRQLPPGGPETNGRSDLNVQ